MPATHREGSNGSPAVSDTVLAVGERLGRGPSERLIRTAFKNELDDQSELFEPLSLVDIAHTLVMMDARIIPPTPGRELLAALLELQCRPADFVPDPANGDLYTNREAWLFSQTAAAAWLGAGRARREATTTAFLIKLREGLLVLAESLTAAGLSFAARARDFQGALVADYTYLQSAQPTTFGHYLLGFAYPMLRDLQRLRALYGRVNRSSAGCGSTNGSRLPQDRNRLSELLGFDGLVIHGRDAMWQADLPIETAALLTAILVNLDRLAEDLQIFATEEFALVELDDGHARASKIMPQKKNPFALTYVRGTANAMLGTLTASAAAGLTPTGQPDNRVTLYRTIPRAIQTTHEAVDLMGEVVSLLRFNTEAARARLDRSFAVATDLAEVLVLESGLDFRAAHRLVGHLVRQHLADGSLNGLTPNSLAEAAEQVLGRRVEISPAALGDALDPRAAVTARTTPGGAAEEAIGVMIEDCVQGFEETAAWVRECRQRLGEAQDSLMDQIRNTLTR